MTKYILLSDVDCVLKLNYTGMPVNISSESIYLLLRLRRFNTFYTF